MNGEVNNLLHGNQMSWITKSFDPNGGEPEIRLSTVQGKFNNELFHLGEPGGIVNPCGDHIETTQLGFCWYEWNPDQTLQGLRPQPESGNTQIDVNNNNVNNDMVHNKFGVMKKKKIQSNGPKPESGNVQTDVNNNNVNVAHNNFGTMKRKKAHAVFADDIYPFDGI